MMGVFMPLNTPLIQIELNIFGGDTNDIERLAPMMSDKANKLFFGFKEKRTDSLLLRLLFFELSKLDMPEIL